MGKTISQQDPATSMADADFYVIEVAGLMKKITKTDASIAIGSQPLGDAQSTDIMAVLKGETVQQVALFEMEDITLHSGIRNGLEISINADPTRFDVAIGELLIVDRNPDPTDSSVIRVNFAGLTGILDTNLGAQISHVFMSSTGVITTSLFPPLTIADAFDQGYLGSLLHFSGVIVSVIEVKIVAHGSTSTEILDLLFAGGTKLTGSVLTGNSDLTMNITEGLLKQLGKGFTPTGDKNAPNIVPTPDMSPIPQLNFFLLHLDSMGNVVVDNASNVLKPLLINTDGLGTLNTFGPTGAYSIIRVFQSAIDNDLLFYFGTEGFNNLDAALMATEPTWVESVNTRVTSPIAKIYIPEDATDIDAGIADGSIVVQAISSRTQL